MAPFSFRAEFEEGRSIDIVPTFIHPRGVEEIHKLEEDDTSAFELTFEGENAIVDGVVSPGRATVKTKVAFNNPTTIFALVRGGWLPLPFSIPARFLVDRNVVISLRKIREGKVAANAQALQWWTNFFAEGTGMFNPLPYAFEAGFRRKPTMAEFVSAFDEGSSELRDALPECHIVRFEDTHYRAAYAQLEAFDERNERETKFLQTACPLVIQRVPRRTEVEVAEAIVRIADKFELTRGSLATLAVLSCLYEDIHGTKPAIGRRILKPRSVYSEADAFNALSDLRHIELAAAGQAYLKQDAFSLCTCDRPMALLWSALSARGECSPDGSIEFTFDLTSDLFSRLSEDELLDLKQLLCI
ncbi:hypothetical protein [Sulfuriferula nivalis]|uniref:Uncharacterized protein n=1 Tax=Sulfuriferula nivalis TaxID=2675298 RepID=A0A809RET2_9PROT|nr:hypothetical protein [Sulfuriferula nivalis]BBP00136.1 hypothetical protein SFSGTM_08440 [Sulfuriferula nivalis]